MRTGESDLLQGSRALIIRIGFWDPYTITIMRTSPPQKKKLLVIVRAPIVRPQATLVGWSWVTEMDATRPTVGLWNVLQIFRICDVGALIITGGFLILTVVYWAPKPYSNIKAPVLVLMFLWTRYPVIDGICTGRRNQKQHD